MPNPSPLIWTLLALLGTIWGSSFLAVVVALEGFTPLQISATRIAGAAVILTAYALATGRGLPGDRGRGRGGRIWLHVLGFGLFSNAVPFSLLAWGQQHVASGFAGVTMAAVPLLVLPLAHLFVPSERLTRIKAIGFVAGFAGTIILIGPGAFVRAGGALEDIARVACIGAAMCYALGSIITRTAPPTGQIAYGAAALVVASAIIVPYALWTDGWPTFTGDRATLAVFYLAAMPTAAATLIMVHIIRNAGSSFLSLVNYQVPVWSVIFGVTLLGESLPASIFIALALILGGLGISQFGARLLRR